MNRILARGKNYAIHSVTGTVMSAEKHLETKVSGGGGGGYVHQGSGYSAPVQIRSTTVTHDDLYVTDADGREHSIRLVNFDVACRQGHAISAVWLVKEGAEKGSYVLIHNKTTGDRFWNDAALNSVHMPGGWRIALILFGGMFAIPTMGVTGAIGAAALLGYEFRVRSACKKVLVENRNGIETYVTGLPIAAPPAMEAPAEARQLPA